MLLKKQTIFYTNAARALENALAALVLVAIAVSIVFGVRDLLGMDWASIDTFYEGLRRALALVIGLEFVRMLVTHRLNVVLELLAFVIARKMLLPGQEAYEIVLDVIAFVILMTARHFMFQDDTKAEAIDHVVEHT